jgi:hypothetical protein
LRKAHGEGASALLRAETPPLDEVPPLNAHDTELGLANAKRRGRPFEPGNKAAVGKKPSLALLGVPLNSADPRYRAAIRKAERYRQRRVRELAIQHGGELGVGASNMVAAAALATAASRLVYELAGERLDTKLLKLGAQLADYAKLQEIAAVGFAQRDGSARPRMNPTEALIESLAEEVITND